MTELEKLASKYLDEKPDTDGFYDAFIAGYEAALRINVVGRSEQLFCSMAGKGFCPYEYENGKCKVEGKCTNHTTKKS
jgi:hypothetical protein